VKKLKRWLLAFALLPACYGVFCGFWVTLHPFKDVPEGSYWFFAGIFSYFAFQWVFFRPIRTYVFGHELTHALAAWMTGGKVKHFHVSKEGGSVHVSKTNFFVALAPYMFPLYSLLLAGILFGVGHFYSLQPYWMGVLWILGVSIGFHVGLTWFALRQKQPDLKPTGRLLSGVIIFLGNTAVVVMLLAILFPKTVSLQRFARVSGHHTLEAWQQIGHGSYVVYREAANGLAHRS
jgi:hypothetical protein